LVTTKTNNNLTKQLTQLVKKLVKTEKELAQLAAQNKELESLLESVNASTKKSNIITIKSATKIEFVPITDIVYCNADYGYTDIQLKDKTITAAKPLSTFEKILDHDNFFKISKSHIINTDYIVTFFKDRNQILLQGDILLDVARRRRVEFLKTLK